MNDQSEAEAAVEQMIRRALVDKKPTALVKLADLRLLLAERRGLREALTEIARNTLPGGAWNDATILEYKKGIARSALQGKGGGGG